MKFLFIILFYFVLISNVDAWNSKGHQTVAEYAYYNSGFELQNKLNLTLMKQGSTAPDLVFHDVVKHHYPPSYYLAERWLQAAKDNYSLKDYNKASYAFGIASHYISDSFVAPHYISKEPSSLHSEFERIKNYSFNLECYKANFNLNQSLEQASKNKEDWTKWTLTKDEEIPRRAYKGALNLTSLVFLDIFNSTCNNFKTEIIKQRFRLNNNIIIFFLLIAICYFSFVLNKKYGFTKRIRF